ncbi:tyrosine-type recombinase/integrase [Beggiatoa leptomitoformis]|uniref:Tyrosine-type recombinase/integrase n=1 Tax=Beggiatoa leptomitoformis TaxID=288004 RepID=A0A2N9YIV9_9GAMM|nr:integrase family protein [Beggiatoa leptomitoformis]ALG67358.1 tyrosine-type recombinase/integrase [Beggiatoa leptomitoformis]AUI70437.1 tyrosine-type recombinase/integrase [Beggiatoa leptomitoformis]
MRAQNLLKLTKTSVEKLPYPDVGQVFYRDTELKGFGLRVTKGSKTYIVENSIRGRACRVTIGKQTVFTAEQARIIAKKLLADIAVGINPNAQKVLERVKNITLNTVFQEFITVRTLKPKTCYTYRQCFEHIFKSWHHKQITDLSKTLIAEHYQHTCQQHGDAYANLCFRLLRSVLNFANASYDDLLPINPVNVLSDKHQWKTISRRNRFIKTHQLSNWWQAVEQLNNTTLRDYFQLLLLTGLRKQEAATLQWSSVDLNEKTLTVLDTKNSQPHTLPLSSYLYTLLQQRQQQAKNIWVFPNPNTQKPFVELRQQLKIITEYSGITFNCHDLRRTFATLAEGLDISSYAIKRLLNHKQNQDVTAGYIVVDVERLREPMEKITAVILQAVLAGREK